MIKTRWFVLLLVLSFQVFGQIKGKHQYKWAMFHPFAALKVKKIYKRNLYIYEEVKNKKILDSIENGGQLDAFRHGFFMACFAQKIKPQKLVKLGTAHEKDDIYVYQKKKKVEFSDYPDSASVEVDLHNNLLGIELGRKYKHLPVLQLKDTIIHYIQEGKFKTIR